MLYVVATPLGNMEDITYRAVSVLREASFVIAENPAHSQKLLARYKIPSKKIAQFAEHNETRVLDALVKRLAEKDACLITDAGTPAISDPGFRLVRACWENNIPVTAVPGPNAAIALLSSAGLPTDRFLFVGFLPKTEPKLAQIVAQAKAAEATLAAYESPQRIAKTAALLAKLAPSAKLVIGRELTKMHEEQIRGTTAEVAEQMQSRDSIKGEITLVLSFK
jgi:16S rRNA (cytidine1402-2'-O)-methyltransferase